MSSDKNEIPVKGLSCGIFRKEITKLQESGEVNIEFDFLNSMLHMNPSMLEKTLEKKLEVQKENRVLIYGDCHPGMHSLIHKGNTERSRGINCCEIILGTEQYKELRAQGAFFLLPEWTIRWREVFINHLGFNEISCKEFMREMHKKLIFIDTGIEEIPRTLLEEASEFCGLPYEILTVSLDHLKDSINSVAEKFRSPIGK